MHQAFYACLTTMTTMINNDFTLRSSSGETLSLGFDETVFRVLWDLFHRVALLPHWIQEVINPIKPTITLN